MELTPHIIKTGNHAYRYLRYDSIDSFHDFVNGRIKALSTKNRETWQNRLHAAQHRINTGADFYGTPPPTHLDELENHDRFLGMHLLKALQPKIKKHLHRYLTHVTQKLLPRPRIAYTDKGTGMFSFDRAAIGLHRTHRIDTSSPIHTHISQLRIALEKYSYTTGVKKVYAYFKDQPIAYPTVRIYLKAGGNAKVKGDDLLYTGLGCSEVARFMEQHGIAVEVNVLVGSTFQHTTIMGIIPVKRFGDPLDHNLLLLLSSDPRYFRFRGFKALIAQADFFKLKIPESLGSTHPKMAEQFIDVLGNDGFVFEHSYSLEDAANEVKRIIDTYHQHLTTHGKAA